MRPSYDLRYLYGWRNLLRDFRCASTWKEMWYDTITSYSKKHLRKLLREAYQRIYILEYTDTVEPAQPVKEESNG